MSLDDAAVARLRLVTTRLARRIRQQAGEDGLSPSRLSALVTIAHRGPLRLGDLATRERLAKPSVTRIVSRLERAGLVVRTPDPADRRSALIAVTAEGRLVLAMAEERAESYLSRQVIALSDDERDLLSAAIPVLERILEARP